MNHLLSCMQHENQDRSGNILEIFSGKKTKGKTDLKNVAMEVSEKLIASVKEDIAKAVKK